MSEHKGKLVTTIFFFIFLNPIVFFFIQDRFEAQAFEKITTELVEYIKEEGGITEPVAAHINKLKEGGYNIRVTHNNAPLNSVVNEGDRIDINIDYAYKAAFVARNINRNKYLIIKRRNAEGSGTIEQARTQTITLTSPELLNTNEYTFTQNISNFKRIRNIKVKGLSSGLATVTYESNNHDSFHVKVSGGTPVRTETVTTDIPEQTKQITNHNNPAYHDADGFVGTFVDTFIPCDKTSITGANGSVKKVISGTCTEGGEKTITKHDTADYSDDEGYKGVLKPYTFVENIPAAQKTVDHTEKRTIFDSKTVPTFGNTMNYNKDEFIGVLAKSGSMQKKLIGGEFIPEDRATPKMYRSTSTVWRSAFKQQTTAPNTTVNYSTTYDITQPSTFVHDNAYKGQLTYTHNKVLRYEYDNYQAVSTFVLWLGNSKESVEQQLINHPEMKTHEYLMNLHGAYLKSYLNQAYYDPEILNTSLEGEPYQNTDPKNPNYLLWGVDMPVQFESDRMYYELHYTSDLYREGKDTAVYEYAQKYTGTVRRDTQQVTHTYYEGTVYADWVDTRQYAWDGIAKKPKQEANTNNNYYKYQIEVEYELDD